MGKGKQINRLSRLEIVLLIILTPIIYFALCYLVTSTEYHYPHRHLLYMFESERIPYFLILGFDLLWLIAVKYLPFRNKRIKIYLTLLILILSAVIITDIYAINMWHHMMA